MSIKLVANGASTHKTHPQGPLQISRWTATAHLRGTSLHHRWQQACNSSTSCTPSIQENCAVTVTLPSNLVLSIQPLITAQYQQVARLRAEAYYENQASRFVESFKKQFVIQEIESLQQRTAPGPKGAPICECLVAMDAESTDPGVLGCIDIRLPKTQTGTPAAGVPGDDDKGAYILNVVVHEDFRGQGIGRALMKAAMQRAVQKWEAASLYTHVEADNEVAFHLYTTCGFKEHSIKSKYGNTSALGRLHLGLGLRVVCANGCNMLIDDVVGIWGACLLDLHEELLTRRGWWDPDRLYGEVGFATSHG